MVGPRQGTPFLEFLLCASHGEGLWGTKINEMQSLHLGSSLEGVKFMLKHNKPIENAK